MGSVLTLIIVRIELNCRTHGWFHRELLGEGENIHKSGVRSIMNVVIVRE